jgi:outer membrane protein assembly factor BamB
LTATSGYRQDRLHVLCFDTAAGKRLGERQFWATGRPTTHNSISGAAPTPACDGQHVYAFFSSNDLFCLDWHGNLVWSRGLSYDHPKAGSDTGMASSPLVIEGVVVVQVENQGESFATGLNAATGETRWRLERPDQASWTSPIALPGSGRRKTAVLLQSPSCVTAHDVLTGAELWRFAESAASIASSVFSEGCLLVPIRGLTALRLSDESDAPEVVWDANRLRPGSSSPLIHDGRVYILSNATVRCGDAKTGELRWAVRLKGTYWATPVLAGGHLYCVNQDGDMQVIKLDDKQGEQVAEHRFGEAMHASPAVAGNALYVRSDAHLWKIAK